MALAVGVTLVALNLADIFASVLLPRAVGIRFRLSARMVRLSWPIWNRFALRIENSESRENFLGAYGPLALVGFLALWAFGLILGYGFIFFGLRGQIRPEPGFGAALYYAGVSFLTVGYGDYTPGTGLTRFVSVLAAANGFAVIAIVTTFLFSLFGAFANRENFVVTFGVRGGAPPSGVTLLETYARLGMLDDLDDVFEEGLVWCASVLETHLAYPILAYFRSSHDYESWLGALGALLDASTLKLTLIDGGSIGHAKLYNEMARHLVRDLADYFRFDSGSTPGVELHEFEVARNRLLEAGFTVVDSDEAWEKFVRMRGQYATALNTMATFFRIPPAQWVGDRSYLTPPH